MDYGIVVYTSITVSNRAKKLVNEANLMSYVGIIQIPPNLQVPGCNYAVRCKYEDLNKLLDVSRKHNLKIKATFRESEVNGTKTYTKI